MAYRMREIERKIYEYLRERGTLGQLVRVSTTRLARDLGYVPGGYHTSAVRILEMQGYIVKVPRGFIVVR